MEDQLQENKQKKDYLMPASILISAILISVSLVYNAGKKVPSSPVATNPATSGTASLLESVRPISNKDHYFGNLSAPVKIIEFSDLECPFCKRFHPTLRQIVSEYNGKVVWIYRHFPLSSLHPRASKEAEASECAAEAGGNDAFWSYIDKIYEVTPSNNGLDPAELPKIAEQIDLDRSRFESCLASGRFADLVSAQVDDAVNSGGRGTPYSIIISAKGKKYSVPGAYPYEQVKLIVEEALKN